MGIRIEALRTFLTVAEEGNIKDAATRLFRTPSAVSMTLSQLEDELAGPLFEGDRKGNLTALGGFVRNVAEAMIRDHDRGMEMIQAFAHCRTGRLRLATVPSVATLLLPLLLRGFIAQHPTAEIQLIDTDSHHVLQLISSGEVDFGICGAPRDNEPVNFHPLFQDPFLIVCSAADRLASLDRPVRWSDLDGTELIVNEASRAIAAPDYVELARKARMTMRNVASLLAMVQAGMGMTLLPALACSALPEGLRALELAEAQSRRVVGAATRSGVAESPLTRAFQEYLNEKAPEFLQDLGLSASTVSYT